MINTTDYASQIVQNLETQGYTKDMIIGYLQATLSGLKYLELNEITQYLKRTVEVTQKAS